MKTPFERLFLTDEELGIGSEFPFANYNPYNKPLDKLPVIVGFNNGGSPGFMHGQLVAEDGNGMGSHLCSSEGYMYGDLGINKGARSDRHEGFREHYPDGYRMAFIKGKNVKNHKGRIILFERNQAIAETEEIK